MKRIIHQNIVQHTINFDTHTDNTEIPQKRCTKCKKIKGTNDFPKNKSSRDGYSTWCKKCNKDRCSLRYAIIREERIAQKQGPSKRCAYCRKYKLIGQFSHHPLATDSLQSLCNDCLDCPSSDILSSCKKCTDCEQWLPFKDFHSSKNSRDGLSWWCKRCKSKRDKTPGHYKKENLWHNYRITPQQYEHMVKSQDGKCACCGNYETHRCANGDIRALSVDHNHQTGQIRALICHECNTAYGLLREDKDRILALLAYYERFAGNDEAIG